MLTRKRSSCNESFMESEPKLNSKVFHEDAFEPSSEMAGFKSSVEHMYKPRESVFGAVARDMVIAGWSIFPQEMDGRRRPGTVDKEMISWSEKHQLATRRPSLETIDYWAAQCATLNVAVVLGPASGNTFVIDVDVVEEELSSQIQEMAERMLGATPLRRVGNWPKIALIYRHSEEDDIPGRSPKFVPTENPENPDGVDQGLEIISKGQAMTFYGKHHKTGRYFTWLEAPPHLLGPDQAPLVTSKQINDFLDAVDSVRPFHRSASMDNSIVTWEWDENAEVRVPRIRASGGAHDWVEDDDGIVCDGREAYLTKLAFRIVTANRDTALSPNGIETLSKTVFEQFTATAKTTGRWKGSSLAREVSSKVTRTVQKIRSGEVKAFQQGKNGNGVQISAPSVYVPKQPRDSEIDSLDFLPEFVDTTKASFDPRQKFGQRRAIKGEVLEPQEGAFAERQIETDRSIVADAVQKGLLKAFSSFWDEVYDLNRTNTRVHILKAPTGAGKTSRGISFIAEDPRTKDDYTVLGSDGQVEKEGRCPILFLLPTYANIDELRSRAQVLNLDASLSDKDLRHQAHEKGLIHEDDLPAKLAELRRDAKNAGLETMVYQGKLKAGCAMAEKVKMAMEAGLGTSGFCKAEIPTKEKDDDGKTIMEEKFCPHYYDFEGTGETCPAIKQKEQIEKSHVVFMPHAFLALSIPDELKHVRAVVADERIHHLFLHTANIDHKTLVSPRKIPKQTKKEKEEGVDTSTLIDERREAVDVVNTAFLQKVCPAKALAAWDKKVPIKSETTGRSIMEYAAEHYIKAAIRCCGASIQKEGEITPDIEMEELKEICAQPTGHQAREEHRFWKILEERVSMLREDEMNEKLAKDSGNPEVSIVRKCKGDREMRIQYLTDYAEDGEPIGSIRISWRETPNWVERPLLLLDASAAPEMIKKIWSGKDVVTHDIPAGLNVRVVCVADRTYSNASVIAPPSATAAEKVASARILSKVRKSITKISAMYGWSRVVAGGSILVRRAVNTMWEGPHNVDWCHYGAMRGLDFAKHHAAAISVGRMELPVRTIDGLVAALTYDDDEPEKPFDINGTGHDIRNQSLRVPMGIQKVKMRSGHNIHIPVPMFPGKWGRMIQRQYREEELLQFLGRLRPVYREGVAPIWFSLSSVIPEEVVVDDIISMDDLLSQGAAVWDAMRRCNGILDERLAAHWCDDQFSSPRKAAALMKRAGIDSKNGDLSKRLAWGIVSWKWTTDEGDTGYSFTRAEMEAPEEALRNEFKSALGITLANVEQVSEPKAPTLARGRKSDTIEDELGTLSERKSAEHGLAVESAIDVLMNTQPEDIEQLRKVRMDKSLPIVVPTAIEPTEPGKKAPVISIMEADAHLGMSKFWEKIEAKKAAQMCDLGTEAAFNHAETGEGVDATYDGVGGDMDDGINEFRLLEHDSEAEEIPY